MGFNISWLAVNGKSRDIALNQLGLESTNTFGEFFDHPVSGFLLPSGWYLVVTDDSDHHLINDTVLASLSAGCSVITCQAEEHVMFSSVALWESGRNLWSVRHSGDEAIENLEVKGTPPDAFNAIRDGYIANQKEDDDAGEEPVDWYFEIPLELAKKITGFKHDEITDGIPEEGFELLTLKDDVSAVKPRKKFL